MASKTLDYIPVNIWDDFYEDGYVPVGEVQSTYMYIETSNVTLEDKEQCLLLIKKYIEDNNILKNTKLSMVYFDSAIKYPKVALEMPSMVFKRWELHLNPLTHKDLDHLLECLQKSGLKFNSIPMDFYSES